MVRKIDMIILEEMNSSYSFNIYLFVTCCASSNSKIQNKIHKYKIY